MTFYDIQFLKLKLITKMINLLRAVMKNLQKAVGCNLFIFCVHCSVHYGI